MSVLRLLIVRTRCPTAKIVDIGISRRPSRGELLAVIFAVMASDADGSVGLVKATVASSRSRTAVVLDDGVEGGEYRSARSECAWTANIKRQVHE